ncbi:MAG TPA: ATP-binding cassette domain-containing protein [Anaerolineae bacterium]
MLSLFNHEHPVGQDGAGESGLIRIKDVVKTFKVGSGEVTVLKGINAEFHAGEFVGIIGKSGSGKSTLINMLTGIDRPTAGEVTIGDTRVDRLGESRLASWRGRNLGIVFQFFQLLPMLSLVENVMLPMDFCNMYAGHERKARALKLLDMVGLADQANKLPLALSGGQQQRVAIARALANDPPIVVADEPTGNLDSKTAETVFEMFEALVKEGKTIVMVTHDSSLARRVNRTVLLADGEIVNEWVARALPLLTHQQMLAATHALQPLCFNPGQEIMRQDEPGDRFYIIEEGSVEIALKRPGGNEVVVTRLGPGQYFGEIELLRNRRSLATVRAAGASVQVYALPRETFASLLAESDPQREQIGHVVSEREGENRTASETGRPAAPAADGRN